MISIPDLGLLVGTIQVLGMIAAVHALLTVRTAQGAIAWATSLFFMPYLTLVPYLIFGRSRFDAYIAARRQANEEMHQAANEADWRPWLEEALGARHSSGYRHLQTLARMTHMPSLANNQVSLLIDGHAAFEAMFQAISTAKEIILVQFFIVRDDALGRRLQQLLIDKAAEGVQIYFMYDAIGSHSLPYRYVKRLRRAGVRVQGFRARRGMINRFLINFRNHRKILVIDGERGFVGGLNVGVDYLGENPPLSPWRDTHIELCGPVVTCLQEIFAEDWYWVDHQLPPMRLPKTYDTNGMLCQVVATGPADDQETCSLFFTDAIHSAQKRIWITSPYFVPDESVSSALRLAVLRGVDVRIMIPARADHRIVFAVSTLYAFDALRYGARIFSYQPGFMHQKVVLIDHNAAAIGSANMDNRSFRLNFEVMVVTFDETFAAEVEAMLLDDFERCIELTPKDRKSIHRLQQLGMRIARLISPVL